MTKVPVATVIAAAALFAVGVGAQEDVKAVIDAATAAMGAQRLESVSYTGTGSTNPTGQAFQSGGAWPQFTVTQYRMFIGYAVPAMRQELVRVDDVKPTRGGGAGGYNPTTFQGGIRPVPGDIVQNQTIDGRTEAGALRVWLTPHGFLKGAAAHAATATIGRTDGKRTVSFRAFDKYTVRGVLNAQNLVERVETIIDVEYTGDTVIDGIYADYRDFGGIKFPTHITMREGGFSTLDLRVTDVRPNDAEAAQRVDAAIRAAGPQAAGAPARTAAAEQIAPGVWFLTPGIEGSLLVEFSDHLVIVEAPAGEAYSVAALEQVRRMHPQKPIRYVVNTHHHADHAAGLRTYIAEGIPVITHESHRNYYLQQIFRNPHSIRPDRLARTPRAATIETMTEQRVLTDGQKTLALYLMKDQPHSEGLLMAYLPEAKLLIQADAYIPRPGAPPLPAPSPYTLSLVENVARLKLDVERVAHIHGGISPYADVLASVGRGR